LNYSKDSKPNRIDTVLCPYRLIATLFFKSTRAPLEARCDP
jgi:hypothetical protein